MMSDQLDFPYSDTNSERAEIAKWHEAERLKQQQGIPTEQEIVQHYVLVPIFTRPNFDFDKYLPN